MDYTKTYQAEGTPSYVIGDFVTVTVDEQQRDGAVVDIRTPEELPGYFKYQVDVLGRGDGFWFWPWELQPRVMF